MLSREEQQHSSSATTKSRRFGDTDDFLSAEITFISASARALGELLAVGRSILGAAARFN